MNPYVISYYECISERRVDSVSKSQSVESPYEVLLLVDLIPYRGKCVVSFKVFRFF